MKKKFLKILIVLVAIFLSAFFFYFNNTNLVHPKVSSFYTALKDTLSQKGYKPSLLVISTKRVKWHNDFQVKFSGAAKESKHLDGDAIDFIVLDINADGNSDSKDVDIVFAILDKTIMKYTGGIGTYKTESSFINKQMIHIDCRDNFARWAR